MATWIDPQTKRTIRQLTDFKGGARLGYFRMPRHVPGGLVLIHVGGQDPGLYALDVESGKSRRLGLPPGAQYLKLYSRTGRLWLRRDREVWAVDLPDGKPEWVVTLPAKIAGGIADVTCDGSTLILLERRQDLKKYPIPTTMDLDRFWHYFSRPRTGVLSAFDLASGRVTKLVETDGVGPDHVDCSPADPGLVRYCLDMYDAFGQRVWTVRTDGSGQRKVRPQERGELITHEFWWSDPELIGFTYQDRRQDPTVHEKPWAEYSPCPTRLGLARVRDGREFYLSQPLNSYHSHLFAAPDGRRVCGEGTDGDSFVYAAPFSLEEPRIEMKAMATIHTPYVPFRGQMVDAGFSADSKWLLFNDTVDGRLQVCACEV